MNVMQKNVLITAGPTREYIDPIRYISNASSGKMGLAIAEAFIEKGAEVRLITGPTSRHCEELSDVAISVTKTETAEQMRQTIIDNFQWADIVIMAAAVADYRPIEKAKQKIKKKEQTFNLRLEKTPDILGELASQKRNGQILVGFALETEDLLKNAQKKLEEKNLDFIIANTEKAIDSDSADFFVINRNEVKEYKNISKMALAKELVELVDSRTAI